MLLKHLALIMLHDYLHCLVFKEQSVYRLSFQATYLSYRIQLSLSTSFLENFQSFLGHRQSSLPVRDL